MDLKTCYLRRVSKTRQKLIDQKYCLVRVLYDQQEVGGHEFVLKKGNWRDHLNSYCSKNIHIKKKKEYSYFGEALVMNYDILHSNKLIFGKVMGLIEQSTVFKLFQKVKISNFCDL